MERRETIKSLLLGSVAAGMALNGCTPKESPVTELTGAPEQPLSGRTKKEALRDKELLEADFLNEHELLTISALCDIILPGNQNFGSASDAIVKDMPAHQMPIRGGIMWLDGFCNKLYNKSFVTCSGEQQLSVCDQIAYPNKTRPELKPGELFFTRIRNLSITGYFTSKMGIEDLGYKGNTPNVWDGVPKEILKEYSVDYEDAWLAKCVDQTKRNDIAEWDDEGNLLT